MTSAHPTLGNVIEICIATRDHRRTIRELVSFGIGPWKVYTFDTSDNISNATINTHPAPFRLRVGFAQLTKDIAYEVIEPLDIPDSEGEDIFSSWLAARNGQAGIHHIAYDCGNIAWNDRVQRFQDMGADFVQGGTWHGKKGTCQFAWFGLPQNDDAGTHNRGSTSTFFETILFSDDWEDPEPDAVY